VSLQEQIVAWRFAEDSIVKTILGLWAKWSIELLILFVPTFVLVYVVVAVFGLTASSLPHVPTGVKGPAGAAVILTGGMWVYEFRCMLAARLPQNADS